MAMAAATGQKRANGEGDDYDDYDGGRDEVSRYLATSSITSKTNTYDTVGLQTDAPILHS